MSGRPDFIQMSTLDGRFVLFLTEKKTRKQEIF